MDSGILVAVVWTGVYEKSSEEMGDVIEAAFVKADVEDEVVAVGIEVVAPVIVVEAHAELLYWLSVIERKDSHHRCWCCCWYWCRYRY